MSARRSSAASSRRGVRGYTLLEVLVAFGLTVIVAIAVGTSYVFATRGWTDHQARLRTQQQLRSAAANVSRETRLAGTCMTLPLSATPPSDFQPLAGVNNGTTDQITIRANPRCAIGSLSGYTDPAITCPCASLTLDNVANFAAGTWVYIYSDGANHRIFRIQSVVGNVVNIDPAFPLDTGTYTTNAGANQTTPDSAILAVEQRTFQVDGTCGECGGIPSLTLTTLDMTTEAAVAKGIDRLDIRYILNRPYNAGTCDAGTGGSPNLCVVNLPASSGDWTLVRVVTFDVGARSIVPVRAADPDGYLHLGQVFEIAPRNAVFQTRL